MYSMKVWRCNYKYEKGKPRCQTSTVRDVDIKAQFIMAFNAMVIDKKPYMEACEAAKAVFTDTSAMDTEIEELRWEIEVIAGLTRK